MFNSDVIFITHYTQSTVKKGENYNGFSLNDD